MSENPQEISYTTLLHEPIVISSLFSTSLTLHTIYVTHTLNHTPETLLASFIISYTTLESGKWFLWRYQSRKKTAQIWADDTLARLEDCIKHAKAHTWLHRLLSKSAKLYLVLGNRQSGKSTMLQNAGSFCHDKGFQFQDKGIIFHQWWHNAQYICLETSALSSQEIESNSFQKYMQHLFQSIQWKYQANGYSGIIVNVSCQSLLNDKNQHLNQKTTYLQKQLEGIASFAPSVPVFVVITFFDIIPNFKTFFHDFEHQDFDKPFGFTTKKGYSLIKNLKKQLQNITEALEEHLIQTIEKYPHHVHADMHEKIHAFQYTIYNLQPKILHCIEEINESCPNPIKGVLYTCQHIDKKDVSNQKNPSNLPSLIELNTPKAFFSKNILHAINQCTKRSPSRKNQLLGCLVILAYLLSLLGHDKTPLLHTLPHGIYEQLTIAPSSENLYKKDQSTVTLFPFHMMGNELLPDILTEELSVLNNPNHVYPTIIHESIWPRLQAELQSYQKSLPADQEENILALQIFYAMLTGRVSQNKVFMHEWISTQLSQYDEIFSVESEQQLQDIVEQGLVLKPQDTFWIQQKPYSTHSDFDQINIIQQVLTSNITLNQETGLEEVIPVAIACQVKDAFPQLFGNWQAFENSSTCTTAYPIHKSQAQLSINIEKIKNMLHWDSHDRDLSQFRKKLVYLEQNILEHLDNLQTFSQKVALSIRGDEALTEAHETLLTNIANIDPLETKSILKRMIQVLSNITVTTHNQQSEVLTWVQSIAKEPSQAKILKPNVDTNIFIKDQLHQFWKAIIANATIELNEKWQNTMVKLYQHEVSNHFPFSKGYTARDTDAEIFHALFSPDGKMSVFFDNYLGSFIEDDANDGLQWTSIAGYKLPLSDHVLHMIMTHKVLQKMYYGNQSDTPLMQGNLQFNNASPDIRKVTLRQGHQNQSFTRERPLSIPINWPIHDASITLEAELENGDIVTFAVESGYWNSIKLLRKHIHQNISDHHKNLRFQHDNTYLELSLHLDQALNPFTEDIAENFHIPTKIY